MGALWIPTLLAMGCSEQHSLATVDKCPSSLIGQLVCHDVTNKMNLEHMHHRYMHRVDEEGDNVRWTSSSCSTLNESLAEWVTL